MEVAELPRDLARFAGGLVDQRQYEEYPVVVEVGLEVDRHTGRASVELERLGDGGLRVLGSGERECALEDGAIGRRRDVQDEHQHQRQQRDGESSEHALRCSGVRVRLIREHADGLPERRGESERLLNHLGRRVRAQRPRDLASRCFRAQEVRRRHEIPAHHAIADAQLPRKLTEGGSGDRRRRLEVLVRGAVQLHSRTCPALFTLRTPAQLFNDVPVSLILREIQESPIGIEADVLGPRVVGALDRDGNDLKTDDIPRCALPGPARAQRDARRGGDAFAVLQHLEVFVGGVELRPAGAAHHGHGPSLRLQRDGRATRGAVQSGGLRYARRWRLEGRYHPSNSRRFRKRRSSKFTYSPRNSMGGASEPSIVASPCCALSRSTNRQADFSHVVNGNSPSVPR